MKLKNGLDLDLDVMMLNASMRAEEEAEEGRSFSTVPALTFVKLDSLCFINNEILR